MLFDSLLALFSIVTLLAARLPACQRRCFAAAWYPKPSPTFADALAVVRCALCDLARAALGDITSPTPPDRTPLPPASALQREQLATGPGA